MKITAFNPMIISPKAGDIIELFKELGFEVRHQPTEDAGKGESTTTRMKDSNGNYIDITGWEGFSCDVTEIRMNVDDFEEAYNILVKHGFINNRGDDTVDLKTSKTAVMVAPTGFSIALVKHIKEEDE